MLIFSDIVKITLYPFIAAAIASPTPVLPDVGSTMVPPGCNNPFCSASSIIAKPILSFTLPPGLRYSSFTKIVGFTSFASLFNFTSGVLPITSKIFCAYFIIIKKPPIWGGQSKTKTQPPYIGIPVQQQILLKTSLLILLLYHSYYWLSIDSLKIPFDSSRNLSYKFIRLLIFSDICSKTIVSICFIGTILVLVLVRNVAS